MKSCPPQVVLCSRESGVASAHCLSRLQCRKPLPLGDGRSAGPLPLGHSGFDVGRSIGGPRAVPHPLCKDRPWLPCAWLQSLLIRLVHGAAGAGRPFRLGDGCDAGAVCVDLGLYPARSRGPPLAADWRQQRLVVSSWRQKLTVVSRSAEVYPGRPIRSEVAFAPPETIEGCRWAKLGQNCWLNETRNQNGGLGPGER